MIVGFAIWRWTGHWYWGVLEWAVMVPIIAACIWKYDFGTWRFWSSTKLSPDKLDQCDFWYELAIKEYDLACKAYEAGETELAARHARRHTLLRYRFIREKNEHYTQS